MMQQSEPRTNTEWKCATTKQVSRYWKSAGGKARISPDKPPMVNSMNKAIANNIGVSHNIAPSNMIAAQLNTYTPVGTAISMVAYMKNNSPAMGIPTVNMRCAHTVQLRKAIDAVAYTMDE